MLVTALPNSVTVYMKGDTLVDLITVCKGLSWLSALILRSHFLDLPEKQTFEDSAVLPHCFQMAEHA